MARPSRGIHVRQRSDFQIGQKGSVANQVAALAGNYSISVFANEDQAGRFMDITELYAAVNGNSVAIIGWITGKAGVNPTAASHAIVNLAAPPVNAYDFKNPTDPSTQLIRFGTQNGGQVLSNGGTLWRIPAGFSLTVRPDNQNVQIHASINFVMERG